MQFGEVVDVVEQTRGTTSWADLPVLFEIHKAGHSAEESFSIDAVEMRNGFVVLISHD